MEPELWPLDPASAVALVERVLEELDSSTEEQQDALLCDLLALTWGNILAQNQ